MCVYIYIYIYICKSDSLCFLPETYTTLKINYVKMKVAQWCLTLWPRELRPPGSSIHGILQARILEWIASPFPRGPSQPRDQTQISWLAGGSFTVWAIRESTILQFKKLRYQAQPRNVYITQKCMCVLYQQLPPHPAATHSIAFHCFLQFLSICVLYAYLYSYCL